MLDWNKELKTEPPLISRFSDEEVTRILDNSLEVPDWCNHTQAVERAIKAVTESCTALNWSGAEEPLYPATETFTENVKIQHEEGVLQQHIEFGINLLYAQ